MQKKRVVKDFDFYIDEYMYYCRSRRLRPKTVQSYEQTLRLFERWCLEEENIAVPEEVSEQVIRRYICSLQDRGKYTFYADKSQTASNNPDRRRDYRQTVGVTTINNYIRNLRAFFTWYADERRGNNPMDRIRQLPCERKPQELLEDEEVKLTKKAAG